MLLLFSRMILKFIQVWSCTSVRVAQTRQIYERKVLKILLDFLLNSGFSPEKKFYRKQILTVLPNELFLAWKRTFFEKQPCRRALGLQKCFKQKSHRASKIVFDFCAEKVFQPKNALRLIHRIMILICMEVQLWVLVFEPKGSFQPMNDASSIDVMKQNLNVAQTQQKRKVPQHRQLDLSSKCNDVVEMYSLPTTPHDRDVMHKVRRKFVTITSNSQIQKHSDCTIAENWWKILIRCLTWH